MKRLLTFVLLFTAFSAFAETRHQVFKIQFHSRIPTRILLSQSLLAEDHTYTDGELNLAMDRLRRLPFVYAASYTLEGSMLVVTILDEHTAFYQLDATGEGVKPGGSDGLVNGGIGGRRYFSSGGVVQGSLGAELTREIHRAPLRIQYSQYGILGTRAFGTAGLSKETGSEDIAPEIFIGYPLTLRQTISFNATHFTKSWSSDFETSSATGQGERHTIYGAQWAWDTRNDPWFITTGSLFSIAPQYSKDDTHFRSISRGRVVFSDETNGKTHTLDATAEKFWNYRARSTLFSALDLEFHRINENTRTGTNPFMPVKKEWDLHNFRIGYAHNFFDSVDRMNVRRFRFEAAIGLVHNANITEARVFSNGIHVPRHVDTRNYREAQLGYAFRNRFGLLHFVASYWWL